MNIGQGALGNLRCGAKAGWVIELNEANIIAAKRLKDKPLA